MKTDMKTDMPKYTATFNLEDIDDGVLDVLMALSGAESDMTVRSYTSGDLVLKIDFDESEGRHVYTTYSRTPADVMEMVGYAEGYDGEEKP